MDVKNNIANNIAELRKNKKLTQAELAEKLCYSDKAVSKWERAESTPDVEILYKMSELFGVSVDFFFQEDSIKKIKDYRLPDSILKKKIALLGLILTSIWFIAVVIFVYSLLQDISLCKIYWIAFVWPVPICLLISSIYFNRMHITKPNPYLVSGFLWSLLAAIYLQALILDQNIWLIFLVGIPLQFAIIVAYYLKK